MPANRLAVEITSVFPFVFTRTDTADMNDLGAFLILLGVFILGLFARSYLPGYMTKKGENLATKEDIAEITTKIETVKASISVVAEQQRSYLQTRTDLLMRFHDQLVEVFYERLAVNFGDFPSDFGKSLFDHQMAFYRNVAETMKAYQRLTIYLPPGSAIAIRSNRLVQHISQVRLVHKNKFGAVKRAIINEQRADRSELTPDLERVFAAGDAANSEYWKAMKPHVEALKDDLQLFAGEMNEFVRRAGGAGRDS